VVNPDWKWLSRQPIEPTLATLMADDATKPMAATGAGMASMAPADYSPAECVVVVTPRLMPDA